METLFFSVLPRYPMFYTLMDSWKEKFLISLIFSKITQIHFGYQNFLAPFYYETGYEFNNKEGQIKSSSKLIQEGINKEILLILEKMQTDL